MRIFARDQGGASNDSGVVDDIFWLFRWLLLRKLQREGQHCLQSEDKDQQESRAVAGKLHDDIVKFDTYRYLQRHQAVLPAIAQLSCYTYIC